MSSEDSITISSCSSTSTAYSEQIQLAIAETDTFGFFKAEVDPMWIVAKYLQTESDFINFVQISKRFEGVLENFEMNPIPIKTLSLFPHIKKHRLFSKKEKRIKGMEKYIYDCCLTRSEVRKMNDNNVIFKRMIFQREKNSKKHHIPKLTTEVSDNCFYKCDYLKSISIPFSVTSIGQNCFAECTSLSKIVICSSLLHLGKASFENCKSLRHIVIPSLVKEIPENCFKDCLQLIDIVLPIYLTRIGHSSFENCVLLTELLNTTNVKEFGQDAFKGCSSLKELQLSSSVEYIGLGCFDGCDLLRLNPTFPLHCKCLTHRQYVDNKSDLTKTKHVVMTPEDCMEIGDDIPLKVNVIGRNAFKYNMPSEIVFPNGITRIESNACSKCTLLTSVSFSTNLKIIEAHAFADCIHLKSVSIPPSIQHIGDGAFSGCSGMSSIVIEGSPTIGYHAFSNCNQLQFISIPPFSNQNINDIFHGVKMSSKPCSIV